MEAPICMNNFGGINHCIKQLNDQSLNFGSDRTAPICQICHDGMIQILMSRCYHAVAVRADQVGQGKMKTPTQF